ncbi:LysM domain [Fusarium oxysporum f. sp. vasinfectum]|nr:LysM domain [Fusarium oxysporum f. sp. vasinfectum]
MHFSSIIVQGLLATGVTATRIKKVRRDIVPEGPTDPGITSKCTYYDTWFEDGIDCDLWLSDWNITPEQFTQYNPTVGDNCSGIKEGHSYCVEVNHGQPEEPEVTSTKVSEPKPTEEPKPSPTQDGLIESCTSFYKAKKGDTCPKIIAEYGTFDFDTFFKWNPAIESDCSGIWANTWYCVGVPGTPTAAPTKVAGTSTTPKPTGPSKPSTTQDGIIDSCVSFHQAGKGETCAKIVSNFGTFDFDTFFDWNPAVGKDCSGIWAGYYYCVGVPGTPTVKPSATSPKPTATGGVQTPSPIQEDLAKNCNKFHQITSTTTCASIKHYYNLPLSQFIAWNPAVEKDCSGLWVGYWVCVSVEGYKPTTTTAAKPTTTKPANGILTPSPIQDSMVKNCEKFHQIKSTTTCTSIEDYYNLPFATFYSWNPAIGSKCTSLLTNYWVCVGTIGWKPPTKTTTKAATPTKPSNGINTPPPIQQNMVGNCNKFHMVAKTTTCSSIQNYYSISLTDFGKWNPTVGSNCAGLWAGYNVCVGVIGGTPTQPGNGVKTPSPIQPKMVSNCKKFHKVTSTTTCASIQKYYKIAMAQLVKWNPTVGKGCEKLWADYWVCVGV